MKMCAWLNRHRRVPAQIVAGDFNETPDGPAIQYMKQTFRSAYMIALGHEPLATFPTALAEHTDGWAGCLDYIFLSPMAGRVASASLFCDESDPSDDTLYPSDHVGLVATLEMGETE
jgi:endonuclease/exonuclease/phosphatase family metal-dependent hydrolase